MASESPEMAGASGPLPFAVTGSGELALSADRTGSTTFTVTNLLGRPVRVRLAPKGADAAQTAWYHLAGDTEVQMAVAATISVEVRAKVPADVAEGRYPLALRSIDEADPELLTDGQPVDVIVPKASAPQRGFPLVPVLIGALVVLLLGGGAIWWFLLRKDPVPVAAAPVNAIAPSITGNGSAGEMLTATPGEWSGTPTFTYSWIRCDEMANNCTPIPDATTASYLLLDTDVKAIIRVRVTATNPSGSASAESPNVGPIKVGQVKVPNVKGERFSLASQLLHERGLNITATNVAQPTWCSVIVNQSPSTNAIVDKGSVVEVTVNFIFPCIFKVPNPKMTIIAQPLPTP